MKIVIKSLFSSVKKLKVPDAWPIFIKSKPDIIYHLAAQSLVSKSIKEPIETFKTNIIGTTNILESLRYIKKKCS